MIDRRTRSWLFHGETFRIAGTVSAGLFLLLPTLCLLGWGVAGLLWLVCLLLAWLCLLLPVLVVLSSTVSAIAFGILANSTKELKNWGWCVLSVVLFLLFAPLISVRNSIYEFFREAGESLLKNIGGIASSCWSWWLTSSMWAWSWIALITVGLMAVAGLAYIRWNRLVARGIEQWWWKTSPRLCSQGHGHHIEHICPVCDEPLRNLHPSIYGLWHVRCECGQDNVPTVDWLGRRSLPSRCGVCEESHTSADVRREIIIGVWGNTSSFKQRWSNNLLNSFRVHSGIESRSADSFQNGQLYFSERFSTRMGFEMQLHLDARLSSREQHAWTVPPEHPGFDGLVAIVELPASSNDFCDLEPDVAGFLDWLDCYVCSRPQGTVSLPVAICLHWKDEGEVLEPTQSVADELDEDELTWSQLVDLATRESENLHSRLLSAGHNRPDQSNFSGQTQDRFARANFLSLLRQRILHLGLFSTETATHIVGGQSVPTVAVMGWLFHKCAIPKIDSST